MRAVLSLAEKLCPNITKASTCAATSGTATATATGSAASAASGTATASPDDLDDDPTGTSLPDATGGVTQNSARITAAPNVNAMALLGAAAVYLI
ncbi:hypothetical protein KEM52_005757 [Ascosphaera acerosa]|nr:hypothetical protein KEM52_005757 [Ascosphaera acerosa]